MSIDSVTMRGGVAPWVEAAVEWTGVSTTWTLTNLDTQTVLYTGPGTYYLMATQPELIYRMQLADDTGNTAEWGYVAPPISAPVDLQVTDITFQSALVTWLEVKQADRYNVLVDDVSHTVLAPAPGTAPSLALGGLLPDRTYGVQVQAYMGDKQSLISPLYHFTTQRVYTAEASIYEYEPSSARVWRAAGWLDDGAALIHGDGAQWGNSDGIHTTVFLYSPETLAQMRELAGVRVLTVQVSLSRFTGMSDPRMVLSHWLLHNMTSLPAGAPTFVGAGMGVDSGSVALGEQTWISLPTGWADEIINGNATGFGWGGVAGRYMLAQHINDPIRPRNGTLRITVG